MSPQTQASKAKEETDMALQSGRRFLLRAFFLFSGLDQQTAQLDVFIFPLFFVNLKSLQIILMTFDFACCSVVFFFLFATSATFGQGKEKGAG